MNSLHQRQAGKCGSKNFPGGRLIFQKSHVLENQEMLEEMNKNPDKFKKLMSKLDDSLKAKEVLEK